MENEYVIPQDSFVFAIQKSHTIRVIQGEIDNYSQDYFDILEEQKNKEVFYIKAIQNLLKQKDYINLLYQVSNELISEDEFSDELENNEKQYLIDIDNDLTFSNFNSISKIITKIGTSFTDDDISEIFSIKTSNIKTLLSNNTK
jgi:hypothetical protein